jgi:hypothetical protein
MKMHPPVSCCLRYTELYFARSASDVRSCNYQNSECTNGHPIAKLKVDVVSETLIVSQMVILGHVLQGGCLAIFAETQQRIEHCYVQIDVVAQYTIHSSGRSRAVYHVLHVVSLLCESTSDLETVS